MTRRRGRPLTPLWLIYLELAQHAMKLADDEEQLPTYLQLERTLDALYQTLPGYARLALALLPLGPGSRVNPAEYRSRQRKSSPRNGPPGGTEDRP